MNQNHNPMAQNGAQWALNLLGGIWGGQNIRVRRTLYRNNTSWLNYDGSFGSNIIDRYRWEGGCIVEHVRICLTLHRIVWATY